MATMVSRNLAVMTVSALVAMAACAPRNTAPAAPEQLVVFPPPPDTARVQFLTRISGEEDVGQRRSSFWDRLVGEDQSEAARKEILKPYGIGIGKGRIYVCDTRLPGIEVIDLENKTFEYFNPDDVGRLRQPFNCFVDKSDQWLYVADLGRREVVVFDESGQYVHTIGDPQNTRPSDVFVRDGEVWVSDIENGEIEVYDKTTRTLIATMPNVERGAPGSLYSPTNIAVTHDRLYVSDFGDYKVKIYSLDGEFITSVGSYGAAYGQFARPKGIALDRNHNLYVVDAAFDNVQIFDRDGDLLMFMGGPYAGPGYLWLPAKVVVDYDNMEYFQQYVHDSFDLSYLIFVTNQFGPDKISVYGFIGPREELVADEAEGIVGQNARREPR